MDEELRALQDNHTCPRTLDFSSLQKITTALRMFAYGVTANFMDEYLKIDAYLINFTNFYLHNEVVPTIL